MRARVDRLLAEVGRAPLAWGAADAGAVPAWAWAGRGAAGRGAGADAAGEPVARVLALDPRVARRLEVAADVAVALVDVDALLALPAGGRAYAPLPRFEGLKLDVALAVDEAVPAGDLIAAIERAGKGLVADVELFDLYAGEQVGAGRKSLAWHVLLQAPDKTLTDKDGARFLGRLEKELEALGGVLRRE